jgi:hypothetical protein
VTEALFESADGQVEVLSIHAGVEPLGRELIQYLDAHPIDGVFTTIIHPEAEHRGVRFVEEDGMEIGSLFVPRVLDVVERDTLNHDERAVWDYTHDPKKPHSWLRLDAHCSPMEGSDALVIGERSDPMLLGLAYVFGLKNVIVIPNYPLFNFFPQLASIETEYTDRPTPLSRPEFWHDKLHEIVELGPDILLEKAWEIRKELSYYKQVDINRIAFGTGKPYNDQILAAIDTLEGYEAEFLRPVELPAVLAQHLGIEGTKTYVGNSWDDVNYSHECPELGSRKDGKPKLDNFGNVLIKLAAPMISSRSSIRFEQFDEYTGLPPRLAKRVPVW